MIPVRIRRGPIDLLVVPVLQDNFVYLVCRGDQAVLVDAGEGGPVLHELETRHLRLRQILITHRHADHTAALPELMRRVVLEAPDAVGPVEALSTPGHTAGDVSFYFPEAAAVFTGDTLINGACGRPFDGSVVQLFDSLQLIKKLPPDTLVLGGHDYLSENLRFGLTIEPDNPAISARLELYLKDPVSALFVSLQHEVETNVFLRAKTVDEFAGFRRDKNRF